MTTIGLMKQALNGYFAKRAAELLIPCLAEDIHCYGLSADTYVRNLEEAKALLADDRFRPFMDYRFEPLSEESLSPDSAELCFSLAAKDVTLRYRVTGCSRLVGDKRLLYLLHFSLIDPRQTLTLFSDVAEKRQAELAHDILKNAMPGGILGCYLEDGYPFYCINDTMLHYLGFACEQDFVDDISGLLVNCIYPEDRESVSREMARQLQDGDAYQLEYRLRKQDRQFIWVHEVGKVIRTQEGRRALLAACYDVTKEKEHCILLDSMVNNADGGIGLYRVEEDWRMTPLFANEGVGKLAGLNESEYLELCGEDAIQSIMPNDRQAVMSAIREAIQQDKVTSLTYRVPNRGGGYCWINGFFSRFGEDHGRPVMRAVYTPASMQYEVQSQALNQNETGVCIIDLETDELYYANDAAFRLHGTEPVDYAGKTCCEAFYGSDHQCTSCWRGSLQGNQHHAVTHCANRTLSVNAEVRDWNRHRVVVVYQQDITEQQQLQQRVEESNRELQQLLQNMACGFCVCHVDANKDFAIKYISDGFCRMFEGSKEALLQMYQNDPLHGVAPDDDARIRTFLLKCAEGAGTREITYRYTTLKQTHLWLTLKVVTVSDGADGLFTYATYFDVTDRMQTQKHLYDVVHNVPGGVCMYRWDGHDLLPLIVSDQVTRLFGAAAHIAPEKLLSLDSGLIHPDDIALLHQIIRDNLAHPGETYSASYRVWNAEKNSYRWIRTSGVCVQQDDGSKMFYVTYADINAAKELEQQLLQEEEMLSAACDFANVLAWIYEIPKRRIHCYHKLRQDFDLPEYLENFPESWLSMGFIQPESIELHREKVQAIQDGSSSEEFEARIRHKDGSLHWSRIRFNRLSDNPDLAICTSQLIDNEKYLEARIELEEKQQSEGGVNLMAHFVTNLTQNKPLSHRYLFAEKEELLQWESVDSQLARTLDCIVFPENHVDFLRLHDSRYLLEQFAQGRTSESMDYRRLFPDGKTIWVRSVIHMVQEPKTGDILNYEYLYDINRQKISEELMGAVLSFGYEVCASLLTDRNQVTILRSEHPHGHDGLEIEPYIAINKAYADTILPEDRDMYLKACSLENIRETLKTTDHFEIMHRKLENGMIRYKKDQCYGYSADRSACLLVRSDVTDVVLQERRKQAQLQEALEQRQEALKAKEDIVRDRERIYTALFSLVPMVISSNLTKNEYAMLNYEGYTTKVAARSGSYDELVRVGVGTVPDDQKQLFEDTFKRENVLRAFAEGKKNVMLEHQQMGDDGVMRWIETGSIFVTSETDDDVYTITLAQDVTVRKQQEVDLQKALEAAEAATVAKSEFLSRMSHEIRTPMNAIMGMTAIAKDSRSDFHQVVECLDKIDMSSHFLLTLINDILEMSRIESGRTEIKHVEFSFAFLMESIRTVVEPLALKNVIRYECVCLDHTDTHYLGDAMRIQQVLVNIITNAIKFTKPGGRVRFSVQLDSETAERAQFRFTVADTGIGMSEAFMVKMFTPFTQEDGSNTSQFGGSGLGLAISKSLVDAMGGSIGVDSFQKVGSTFTVLLPLDRLNYAFDEKASADTPKAIVPEASLVGRQVLMAEDHPLNVMVARKLLEHKGVIVTVAENGQIAVDKFAASAAGFFDAVLMDIRMPVMDGLHAARAIRALDRADAKVVPIIAMTANALEEDRQHSREAGMDAHLAKPFEPAQLYAVLAEQIGKTVNP